MNDTTPYGVRVTLMVVSVASLYATHEYFWTSGLFIPGFGMPSAVSFTFANEKAYFFAAAPPSVLSGMTSHLILMKPSDQPSATWVTKAHSTR